MEGFNLWIDDSGGLQSVDRRQWRVSICSGWTMPESHVTLLAGFSAASLWSEFLAVCIIFVGLHIEGSGPEWYTSAI